MYYGFAKATHFVAKNRTNCSLAKACESSRKLAKACEISSVRESVRKCFCTECSVRKPKRKPEGKLAPCIDPGSDTLILQMLQQIVPALGIPILVAILGTPVALQVICALALAGEELLPHIEEQGVGPNSSCNPFAGGNLEGVGMDRHYRWFLQVGGPVRAPLLRTRTFECRVPRMQDFAGACPHLCLYRGSYWLRVRIAAYPNCQLSCKPGGSLLA